ncbi:MAG: XisI protein [Methanosarcinales archaeon]
MDKLEEYRKIIKKIIKEYAQFKPAYGDIEVETVFDEERKHYEMVQVGWENRKRIHGSVIHVDIINEKVWIQHDGTESGIAKELVELGIPKDRIVLAFHPPDVRKYTQYAVA